LAFIGGIQESGKTTFALYLASRVGAGRPLQDGASRKRWVSRFSRLKDLDDTRNASEPRE
jgi:hypothetical protein